MMKSENVTDYERLLYVKSNVSTSSLNTRTKHGLFVLLPIQPEDITLEAYSNFTQILGLYGSSSSSSSSSSASASSSSSSSSFSSSLLQDSEGNTVNDSKNITSDDTMDEPFTWTTDLWFRHSLAVSAVYCLAYTLVFVLGIIGNSFVVAVVFRAPRMRTVTNYFIVNLALADILVCLFCVPATLLSNIFTPWLLGLFMCKVVSFLQGVAVSASINTLVAVSADRFLAICYPLKCQMTRRWARYTIIAIWLFSLVIAFPWYMYFTLRPLSYETPDLMLCVEQWPDELFEVTYFVIANLCLCYIIPLFVITACYVAIWIKVWKRNVPGEKGFSSGKSLNNQIETIMQRSKLKVAKMMIVVVVIFVISWLPLYIIFARAKLGSPFKIGSTEERFFMTMIPIAQWLGASNSCINPVLYAFFNKKYRNGFAAIIKSRKCCGIVHQEQQQHQPSASVHYSRNTMRSNRLARFETQCEYVNSIAAV